MDSLTQILITKEDYYCRKLETFNNQELNLNSYELLEREKVVLMIGEAGIGKTTEARQVLTKWFDTDSLNEYIPIYLSLSDYGLAFDTIEDGIRKKLGRFSNVSNHTLKDIFTEQNFILILDGIDDVLDDKKVEIVFAEAIQLIELYPDNYYFLTQRENRLKIGFQKEKIFRICKLNHFEIRGILNRNHLTIEVPSNYYEIFSNPLFLKAGIEVFKNSDNFLKSSFNRSLLLQEIVMLLLGTWDLKKKVHASATSVSGFSKMFEAISQLAFENRHTAAYSYLAFDDYLEKHSLNSMEDYQRRIITGGLFRFEDARVHFSHRYFRDFFIAYYLYQNFDPFDYEEFYIDIAQNIEWHESLIILVGLINKMDKQDFLLDNYLKSSLSLYVQAVNSKNELISEIENLSFEEYTKRYLEKFVKTYQDVIDRYFFPIKSRFNPYKYFNGEEKDLKVQIQASFSEDKSNLAYTFRAFPSNEHREIVEYKNTNSFRIDEAILISQPLKMPRYTGYSTAFISLEKSQRGMDGSRALALDQIKSELSAILKGKGLVNNLIVDMEMIKNKIDKLTIVKNIDDLDTIISVLQNDIETTNAYHQKCSRDNSTFVEIEMNGVKIIELFKELQKYKGKMLSISDLVLPGEDISYDSPEFDGTVASMYSETRKLFMIKKFFSWTQEAYREMVRDIFPNFKQDLFHFKMFPYKTKIIINKDSELPSGDKDFSLVFYEIPVDNENNISPDLSISNNKTDDSFYIQEMEDGYLFRPDLEPRISYHGVGFTTLIVHGRSHKNVPIADRVYSLIREDLQQILGKID